jgi:hypothetical protein
MKGDYALSEKPEKFKETVCYWGNQSNERKLCVIGETREMK